MKLSAGLRLGTAAVMAASASAQVPEVRLARQYSMGYLQFNVMEHQQFIEKHARALGIPDARSRQGILRRNMIIIAPHQDSDYIMCKGVESPAVSRKAGGVTTPGAQSQPDKL
jgi:hypothetical protein